MSTLKEQLRGLLSSGMHVPVEFVTLFEWIEQRDMYVDRDGVRVGTLYPEDQLSSGWTDIGRPGGTMIRFVAEGNEHLHRWFGHARPDVIERLCVFAKTGSDGSMAALWTDDDGAQKIVHLGSGSGSTLCCVLSESAVDFLRLLAIGYDEICWNENF